MEHARVFALALSVAAAGCAVGTSAPVDAPEPLSGEGFRVLSTSWADPARPTQIAVGPSGVYVANPARGTITRATGDAPSLVVADESAPSSIFAGESAVFFLDHRSMGQLVRMRADGSEKQVLSSAQTPDAVPLAADEAQVYWTSGADLMAIAREGAESARKVGAFENETSRACAVSDLVAVGHDVYGIAACTKDGVASAELLALDTQSGARRIVDAIAGSFSGVAFDDTFIYYAAFSAAGGEIRRATRATGTTSTFVTGLRAGAAGVATDATLDRVFYARGSEILAVPKTGGSAPAVVATVGSYADDAAIVVERVVAGPGGVYAQIGEIDGGAVKSHVVVLE